jgi:5-methylcytosine-specific restriction endonuclease McrA
VEIYPFIPILKLLRINVRVNYREYLRSKTWKRKARAARQRAHYRCTNCRRGNVRLEVHHKTYKRLGHERKSDVTALCPMCHRKEHHR